MDIEVTEDGVVTETGTVDPNNVSFKFNGGKAQVLVNGSVIEAVDPNEENEYEQFQALQLKIAEMTEAQSRDVQDGKARAIAASNSKQIAEMAESVSSAHRDLMQAKNESAQARKLLNQVREEMEEAVREGELELSLSVAGLEDAEVNGLVHKKQTQLIKVLSAGMHVLMVGGAGTGKTTAARKAAEALGVEFYKFQGHKHAVGDDLFGFKSAATGEYVPGAAWEPVTEGGVLFIDELDVCTPSLVKACNSLTDDSEAVQFPHRTVEKHEDFVVCAAANTIGQGASELYTGASGQLDASSLDRLVYIDWGIDENIEQQVAEEYAGEEGLDWVEFVQELREAVNERGVLLEITPRASIKGAKLLAAGFDRDKVEDMVLTNRMSENQQQELRDVLFQNTAEEIDLSDMDPSMIESNPLPDFRSPGETPEDMQLKQECRDFVNEAEELADKRSDNKNYGVVPFGLHGDAIEEEAAFALYKKSDDITSFSEARFALDDLPLLAVRTASRIDGEEIAEFMERAGIKVHVG